MTTEGSRRMARMERQYRFCGCGKISRMSDGELQAEMWNFLPQGVAELRMAAEGGDAEAQKVLAQVREAAKAPNEHGARERLAAKIAAMGAHQS